MTCHERTLVNWREGSLLLAIKTRSKHDFWYRAFAKVGGTGTRTGVPNRVSLIIERCDGCEVGAEAKNCVEGICLRACHRGRFVSRELSRRAGYPGSLISAAAVSKSITNKLRDRIDVLGRGVVVRF